MIFMILLSSPVVIYVCYNLCSLYVRQAGGDVTRGKSISNVIRRYKNVDVNRYLVN